MLAAAGGEPVTCSCPTLRRATRPHDQAGVGSTARGGRNRRLDGVEQHGDQRAGRTTSIGWRTGSAQQVGRACRRSPSPPRLRRARSPASPARASRQRHHVVGAGDVVGRGCASAFRTDQQRRVDGVARVADQLGARDYLRRRAPRSPAAPVADPLPCGQFSSPIWRCPQSSRCATPALAPRQPSISTARGGAPGLFINSTNGVWLARRPRADRRRQDRKAKPSTRVSDQLGVASVLLVSAWASENMVAARLGGLRNVVQKATSRAFATNRPGAAGRTDQQTLGAISAARDAVAPVAQPPIACKRDRACRAGLAGCRSARARRCRPRRPPARPSRMVMCGLGPARRRR